MVDGDYRSPLPIIEVIQEGMDVIIAMGLKR